MQPDFKTYIERVLENAEVLAETLISEGLNVVSGRTDNHMVLLDVRSIG